MDRPTDRQKALLEAEDWRHHAIDYVGSGLGSLASTEKVSLPIGRLVSFSLPSAPVLFLDFAADAHRRRKLLDLNASFVQHQAPQGTWPEDHSGLFDYFEEMISEIVMSFSAIEAFANEAIPQDFIYHFTQRDGTTVALVGTELERRVSLDESSVLPSAYEIKSPKGKKAWEIYRKLKAIRDRLVHLKTVDRRASGPEDQTLWGSLIENRNENFAQNALSVIGSFPALVANRRWYRLARAKII